MAEGWREFSDLEKIGLEEENQGCRYGANFFVE